MSELNDMIITPESRISYVKTTLKHLRNDYIEEIPTEIVGGKKITHKCQKNWFQGVVGLIDQVCKILTSKQQVPPDDFENFFKKYTNMNFVLQTLVTSEDVAAGNKVLDLAIEEMEKIK
ncbi:MAG: hypothetical protein WC526_02660 [Patescibacteria group bacterium]